MPDDAVAFPLTITIGETAHVLQTKVNGSIRTATVDQVQTYTKRPVYIDVRTNRGTHRYRVGRGWE